MFQDADSTQQLFLGDDEAGRLAALRSYDILDSTTERLFDDLVATAQTIANVPIAYMALIDEERQWFKSAIGLSDTETPRNIAFCDHAIRQNEVMIVLDAHKDPRFTDNPLVTGPPHIRFYAGAPIISPEGYAVGTICMSDTKPRDDFKYSNALAALARQAAALLELRKNLAVKQIAAELAADQRDRLWDSSLDMMLIARSNGTIVAGNPAWEQAFGEIDPNSGKKVADYFHEDEDRGPATLENDETSVTLERIMRGSNGDALYLSWNLARQDDLIFGIARDITQDRETEAQLAHVQRMESIGQLTGGIAHDFNNLLTIILGNLDIARSRLRKEAYEKADLAIGNAREGAQRAATLTQRLLAFARRQSLTPAITSVNELIDGLIPLAKQVLDARHSFNIQCAARTWPINIDAAQLENAILNLIVNARDAFDQDSERDARITLKVGNYTVSETDSEQLGGHASNGDFVKICVSDTGSGIADDIAEKIFEPFFTTKETGRGTGLGLSQVQGFVLQSGGFVTLDTEIGKGTTISLWLPAAEHQDDISASEPVSAAHDEMPAKDMADKFVLLVEDNHDLRGHVAELLREEGMDVTEASEGEEAIAILRGMPRKPGLVLSDIRMPRMDGQQLAAHVKSEFPDIPVVLMTGYAGGELSGDGPHADLLNKPFSPDELIGMMRRHLLGEQG
ncbi:response regulator [Sphingorhabdus sp. Alg239-R122]|uniref:response regulator n=1 Tax=Sphingorhabdus sp. Alg239-R122 TaxID=2305989 RepID=UPI0013DC97F2|nr:response regulator [Sphingorhabdus sp. Alg239-R122]